MNSVPGFSRLALGTVIVASLAAGRASAQPPPVPVRYVAAAPTIDGTLDPHLAHLPSNPLAPIANPAAAGGVRSPEYRIGYGVDFLYVFVEIDTAALATRDRAYQNGDGVILVVASPRPGGEATDEFHVLGFSPGTPAARWQQRFAWYRNVDLIMRPLDEARVATASAGGRSFFEILVPWKDVAPNHPWLAESVGFNLCVTRALPGTASARYCAVEDRRVASEGSPRRYVPLAFDQAVPGEAPQAYGLLERGNIQAGAALRLRLATLARSPASLPVTVRVSSGEGERIVSRQAPLDVAPGVRVSTVELPADALPPGGYIVSWQVGDGSAGNAGLSVLSPASFASISARLRQVKARIAPGSAATLQFQVETLERQVQRLRSYDTAAGLRIELERVLAALDAAEKGVDLLARRHGTFRRAFRSAVDSTLQPYSIKVPAGYEPGRGPYPLLVFLHGSGQDDRNELNRAWLPQDFILLAPNARGTSNWYNADHAQEDIREAVADVMANYAVDPSRVILAGFSMGGYGVYRTYKEDPGRYKALAVFSGLPRVPGNAGGPDFLEQEPAALFSKVPIFIFHGGQDRNCPIEQTRALVDRFRAANVRLQFEYEEDKGHEAPGPAAIAAFHAWLGQAFHRETPSGQR
ncbi:MAG TPA: prolyl oligopeptidase family serine peptidase [Vicinamibacterales bacterium]|nr:prolyl oligopeptidase family serine peptidase [Vicinamibacterales bacterium]